MVLCILVPKNRLVPKKRIGLFLFSAINLGKRSMHDMTFELFKNKKLFCIATAWIIWLIILCSVFSNIRKWLGA